MIGKKPVERRSFPNPLAPDSEKSDKEYGLSYAKAIESEWFKRPAGVGKCNFYDKLSEFHNLRLYARGEQPVEIYKDLIAGGRNTSYTKYDWRPIQVAPKFVKLIVNQMMERLYEIKVDAVDSYSTDLKDKHKEYLNEINISQPLAKAAKEALGVDINPVDYENYPQSKEEVDLYMSLNYKLPVEIAQEEALRMIHAINDFDEQQSLITEDVAVIGVGAGKHYVDPTKGFIIERVDPANMVWSFPKRRDFKDVYYYGEIEQNVPLTEIKRRTNGKFTDEELDDIKDCGQRWASYHNITNNQGLNETEIGPTLNLLHFTFKSTKNVVYKKKKLSNGGFRMTKKDETFIGAKSKQNDAFEVVNKVIEVWYEGTLILGTDHLLEYKLAENMVRPKGLLHITYPKYIMYAPEIYQGRLTSLIKRIIPYIDQMQQAHIKLQQMVAKARPSGVFIDIAGLNEINMGNGTKLTPLEQMKIYDETGNIIGTSINDEGEYNYSKSPITELRNGIIENIDKLMGVYNHYLGQLRDAIGIPVGADASMPHPDTLVGIQQQVSLNSNTATRHILDSTLNITKGLLRGVSMRTNDIFENKHLEEMFVNAIGRLNVEALRQYKDISLTDLGINIDLKLDAQEKQQLELNIAEALRTGAITLDDANDIRTINNLKLANQLIKIRRIRREQEKRQHEIERDKIAQQGQQQAAEVKRQADLEALQLKANLDKEKEKSRAEAEIMIQNNEGQIKSKLMEQEFQYQMYLKGAELEQAKQIRQEQEDRKDKRQASQNTQASEMIAQRHNNSAPIDFESRDAFSKENVESMGKLEEGTIDPTMTQNEMDNIRDNTKNSNFESSNDYISGDMGLGGFEPS